MYEFKKWKIRLFSHQYVYSKADCTTGNRYIAFTNTNILYHSILWQKTGELTVHFSHYNAPDCFSLNVQYKNLPGGGPPDPPIKLHSLPCAWPPLLQHPRSAPDNSMYVKKISFNIDHRVLCLNSEFIVSTSGPLGECLHQVLQEIFSFPADRERTFYVERSVWSCATCT